MKKLVRYMKKNEMTGMALAKKLNVSNAAVYTWLTGKARPNIAAAIKLERITRGTVTVYDWK